MQPLKNLATWLLPSIFWLAGPLTARPEIRVAITVDDLPSHAALPAGISRVDVARKMLDALRRHRVPSVYGFINAQKIAEAPASDEVLRLWRAAGHPLGNHTFSHQSLDEVTGPEFEKEVVDNEAALVRLAGKTDWKYFRYPFLHEGNTLEKRNGARKFILDRGYKIAQVTIDFEDWSWNNPYARCADRGDAAAIRWLKETYLQNAVDQLGRADVAGQSLFRRRVPHVLLLHIGAFDAEMLDRLLTAYESRGVKFIPLPEAQSDEMYAIDPGLPAPWGSELTFQIMKARGLKLEDLGLSRYAGYPKEKLDALCR